MNRYYLASRKALVYIKKESTPQFWDKHWDNFLMKDEISNFTNDNLIIPKVKKYLKKGTYILEGGCGTGKYVNALKKNGYRVTGIDFALDTVKKLNNILPKLDIRYGDVRKLPFADNMFDGYISIGVIEHFWEGYDVISNEIYRVLKNGGYLFVSFPYLSILRRVKIKLKIFNHKKKVLKKPLYFYQFAYRDSEIINKLKLKGFSTIEKVAFDGIKGLKDEIPIMNNYLTDIYHGNKGQRLRSALDNFFKRFASHCILLVMRKN